MHRAHFRPAFSTFFLFIILAGSVFWAPAQRAYGQILVETQNDLPISHATHRPEFEVRTYEVSSMDVTVRMRDQAAETQVSQTVFNPTRRTLEVELFFPLPPEAAVQNLTLMVNGEEIPGRLLPRDEARKIYEDIVRQKRDPALMEYVGYGLYKTSIFPVPPGEKRTLILAYSELSPKSGQAITYSYPFGTQKFASMPIGTLTFSARIEGSANLKNIYSPTDNITVERNGNRVASVQFSQANIRRDKDFRLTFSTENRALGATVLSYRPREDEDGYFLALATPEIREASARILPKNVIFVLDRSGSMAGKKIEQARDALRFVLDNLRHDDLFNIIAYDDAVETFKPELQRYSSSIRSEAASYVNNIRSGGSTNIDMALASAMQMIPDDGRPSYVLFLTDGLPTAGETGEMKIFERVSGANKSGARLFAFGVGNDVNARLLDRLASGNGGLSVYVKPDEDLEVRVAELYSGLSRPVMTAVKMDMSGTDINRNYPKMLPDLFEGRQFVWVGRYSNSGNANLRIEGRIGDATQQFSFDTRLANVGDHTHAYVEKIWAVRRVGDLIDQIDLNGKSDELVDELVALSKKHGILTPYTSFLAEEEMDFDLSVEELRTRTGESLIQLEAVSGSAANAQRTQKQAYLQTSMAPPPPVAVDAEGNTQDVSTIRIVGNRTFNLMNEEWVESSLSAEDVEAAETIDQLGGAYFHLAEQAPPEFNAFLTLDRTIVVRFEKRVLRIVRPAS